jgi:hypothetical protein
MRWHLHLSHDDCAILIRRRQDFQLLNFWGGDNERYPFNVLNIHIHPSKKMNEQLNQIKRKGSKPIVDV